MRPSLTVMAGPAPSARMMVRSSAPHAELATDQLGCDEQRGECRDGAEHAECDGLGLDRALRLRQERGVGNAEMSDHRGLRLQSIELGGHRGDVAAPVVRAGSWSPRTVRSTPGTLGRTPA